MLGSMFDHLIHQQVLTDVCYMAEQDVFFADARAALLERGCLPPEVESMMRLDSEMRLTWCMISKTMFVINPHTGDALYWVDSPTMIDLLLHVARVQMERHSDDEPSKYTRDLLIIFGVYFEIYGM